MSVLPLTRILYGALALVASVFYVVAAEFPGALTPGDIGPAAFPQATAVALVLLIAIEWLASRRKWRGISVADATLALTAGGYTTAGILLMGMIGFFVALPPILFGALWLLGERRKGVMAAFSIGFTAFLWGLFEHALDKPIDSFGG